VFRPSLFTLFFFVLFFFRDGLANQSLFACVCVCVCPENSEYFLFSSQPFLISPSFFFDAVTTHPIDSSISFEWLFYTYTDEKCGYELSFFLFLFNQIKFRSIYIYINLYICVVFVFNGGERIWSYVGKRFANENKQTSFLKEMGDGFGNKRFDSVFFSVTTINF
jgi:hypothetical protein